MFLKQQRKKIKKYLFCVLKFNSYVCVMEIKTNEKTVDVARLHMLKDISKKVSIPYSTLYLRKLRGDFEILTISGIEFVVEPEEGFKKMLTKKKKGVK